jgi:hypothetical protein
MAKFTVTVSERNPASEEEEAGRLGCCQPADVPPSRAQPTFVPLQSGQDDLGGSGAQFEGLDSEAREKRAGSPPLSPLSD